MFCEKRKRQVPSHPTVCSSAFGEVMTTLAKSVRELFFGVGCDHSEILQHTTKEEWHLILLRRHATQHVNLLRSKG